jgi:hypothetical protein
MMKTKKEMRGAIIALEHVLKPCTLKLKKNVFERCSLW